MQITTRSAGIRLRLFQKDNWQNSEECIFVRRIVSASNTFEKYNFPIGLENAGGGNCPTQNLVEAYEEGDIRLEATVAQNGEQWPNNTLETFIGGANGQPIAYATPTGYYLKKYVNKSLTIGASNATTERHHWVTFRLGEFYLNYAEAMLNYTGGGYETASGLSMTAAQAVNVVRTRAKLANSSLPSAWRTSASWSLPSKATASTTCAAGKRPAMPSIAPSRPCRSPRMPTERSTTTYRLTPRPVLTGTTRCTCSPLHRAKY